MLRRGGLAYRQGKGGPKTVEDHCGKAGRSKVNRLLTKQTRLFSYIEGLQAETRVYYTLWQCGPELRIWFRYSAACVQHFNLPHCAAISQHICGLAGHYGVFV